MARLFPVRSQFQLETFGERRSAERLESCWKTLACAGAKSRSGAKARYRDFVVLHRPWLASQPQSQLGVIGGRCVTLRNKSVPFRCPFFRVPFFSIHFTDVPVLLEK
jgi:hypothetical protein